uniref:DUF447 family protein n=1 Tax=Schlesneria paludicola TaxID=360056 RepID=A0A7C4LLS2_9PLAN
MIIEGLVTTLDAEGALNCAPMGPIVDRDFTRLTLRPFQSSHTYRNLKVHPYGVFHITDDVLLIAQAALHLLPEEPSSAPAECIRGRVLENCCRWYEFRVLRLDDAQERTVIDAEVIHAGRRRDFLGFNRAKHAVLEAAILATRLHLLPPAEVRAALQRLQGLVEKTGGATEQAAWNLICEYIAHWQPPP